MERKMGFEEYVQVGELNQLIRTKFPENYEELVNEIIKSKNTFIAQGMLVHLNTLLLNIDLNERHLFTDAELEYTKEVRGYIGDKIRKIVKDIDKGFLDEEGGLSKKQKTKYSKKENVKTYAIHSDERKWALKNWEEMFDWYELPFYKKWFTKPPKKEFTQIK